MLKMVLQQKIYRIVSSRTKTQYVSFSVQKINLNFLHFGIGR